MPSDRVRSILGLKGNYQQYHDLDDVIDLAEISDPETLEDETKKGWREWASENTTLAIAGSLLGLASLALMLSFAWRVLPDLLSNRLLQGLVVASLIFVGGYKAGWSGNQNRIVEIDRLVLIKEGEAVAFWGTYIEGAEYPLFVAIKGFHRGRKAVPYKVRDVDASIVNRRDQVGVSLDDPAIIRLNRNFAGVTETETGTVVAQETGGLKIDHPGRESTLVASLPNHADEELVIDLKNELESKETELVDERQRAKRLKRQRDNAWEEALEPVEDQIDQFIENYQRIEQAKHGRRRRRKAIGPQPDTDADHYTNGYDDEHEEVDEVVSNDE